MGWSMDRLPRVTGRRRAGIVLIAVGIMLTLALVGMLAVYTAPAELRGAAHAPTVGASAPAAASHLARASNSHPSVAPAATATVAVSIATTFTTYTVLPVSLVFSVSVTNSVISTANTSLWLNITDTVTSTTCVSNNITSLVSDTAAPTAYYFVTLNSAYFTNYSKACPTFLGDGGSLNIAAVENGQANGVVGTNATALTSFVLETPSSLLNVLPITGSLTTYSLYANYTAQYVGKVQLSIYGAAGAVIFTTNLAWNGSKVTTAVWTEATQGVYPYTLTVFTAYGGFNSTGSVSLLPTTTTYTNTTSWTNTTLWGNLSPGTAGTILLIAGLLIGMIVALAVGRMVWGGPKAPGPAQPWTDKKSETMPAANTCSVCGRSFDTPEELAAHSKSEHGMT